MRAFWMWGLFALFFRCSEYSLATDPDLPFYDSEECTLLLQGLLRNSTRLPVGTRVGVSQLYMLEATFKDRGFTNDQFNRLVSDLNYVMEIAQRGGVFKDTAEFVKDLVERPERNERQVLCLLSGSCAIPMGDAGFIAVNSRSRTWDVTVSSDLTTRNTLIRKQALEVPVPEIEPVILPIPSERTDSNISQFASHLLHELLHVRDMRFLHTWLRANVVRIRNGQSGDVLFNRFVMVDPKTNELIVHDGFESLFLEGRAYQLTAVTDQNVHGRNPETVQNLNASARGQAFKEVEINDPNYANLITGLNLGSGPMSALSRENIFESANAITKYMQKTIDN